MNETPENSGPTPLQPPKKPRRVHRPASGPKVERAVAEMRAVGLSQKTIAAKLDISQQTVSQVLKREHVQVDIAAMNQGIKEAMLTRAERLTLKAMGMAEDKVDQGDAKGSDQAMRGVHSVVRSLQRGERAQEGGDGWVRARANRRAGDSRQARGGLIAERNGDGA